MATVPANIEKRNYDLRTKCPSCRESPIKPHHMGCTHIFCYVCLKVSIINYNRGLQIKKCYYGGYIRITI